MENNCFTPNHTTVKKKIYITGLTAIGKTKLSIILAKYLTGSEIVNSDSQ
jgi:tRNA A37 N6-isopentenylltransferase MiaA